MEGKLQTSFIPKKPLIETKKRSASFNIFSIISWLVFIATLALAGGIWGYNFLTVKSIESLNKELKSKILGFDNDAVEQVSALNSRIESAKKILSSHIVVSKLFELLEEQTLKTVQFKSFNYTMSDNGRPALVLTGVAPSFSSVALQSDIFGEQNYIKSQLFSDLALDQSGGVTFKFSAAVDPNKFRYSEYIREMTQPVTVTATTTPTPTINQ